MLMRMAWRQEARYGERGMGRFIAAATATPAFRLQKPSPRRCAKAKWRAALPRAKQRAERKVRYGDAWAGSFLCCCFYDAGMPGMPHGDIIVRDGASIHT